MKRGLFICLMILSRLSIWAQTDDFFLGKWYVEKVLLTEDSMTKEQTERMKDLVSAFSKCSFKFEENGKFSFDFSFKEMQIPEGKWIFDSVKKEIKITEVKDDKSVLMMITIEKDTNGEIYFLMLETPLKLKMKRVNNQFYK